MSVVNLPPRVRISFEIHVLLSSYQLLRTKISSATSSEHKTYLGDRIQRRISWRSFGGIRQAKLKTEKSEISKPWRWTRRARRLRRCSYASSWAPASKMVMIMEEATISSMMAAVPRTTSSVTIMTLSHHRKHHRCRRRRHRSYHYHRPLLRHYVTNH